MLYTLQVGTLQFAYITNINSLLSRVLVVIQYCIVYSYISKHGRQDASIYNTWCQKLKQIVYTSRNTKQYQWSLPVLADLKFAICSCKNLPSNTRLIVHWKTREPYSEGPIQWDLFSGSYSVSPIQWDLGSLYDQQWPILVTGTLKTEIIVLESVVVGAIKSWFDL